MCILQWKNHCTRAFQQTGLKILVVIQCKMCCTTHMFCIYLQNVCHVNRCCTYPAPGNAESLSTLQSAGCHLDQLSHWLNVALSSWQAHFSCFFSEFCSEFCTVPGSKIASSKIQVLLGHASDYHADRASLIFR